MLKGIVIKARKPSLADRIALSPNISMIYTLEMKLSILSAALLAGLVSCQTVTVFTTVGTVYVISTQGQTGPPTTETLSMSIISSFLILSTLQSSASSKSTSKSSTSTSISSATFMSPAESLASTKASTSSSSTSFNTKISSRDGPALPAARVYQTTGLYYHNKHRLNHSAPIMTWNPTQAAIAAQIASSCKFAHNMTVGGGGYGQNLAAYGSSGAVATFSPALMLAKAITTQWYYGEVKNFLPAYYGRATPDLAKFAGYGHFTQLVWSGSATVGCASRFCAAGTIFSGVGSWFTVCNYVAPGNYIGSFGRNVFPPRGLPAIAPL
ncbi:CAP domain-containing protein [Hyaloscypha sp. PMI_1271]|nr:CAP domain-containing protein [Hyaloscypha sp. PMI_1271]